MLCAFVTARQGAWNLNDNINPLNFKGLTFSRWGHQEVCVFDTCGVMAHLTGGPCIVIYGNRLDTAEKCAIRQGNMRTPIRRDTPYQ